MLELPVSITLVNQELPVFPSWGLMKYRACWKQQIEKAALSRITNNTEKIVFLCYLPQLFENEDLVLLVKNLAAEWSVWPKKMD